MRTLREVQRGSANGSADVLDQERYNERLEIGGLNLGEEIHTLVEANGSIHRVEARSRDDYYALLETGGRAYQD